MIVEEFEIILENNSNAFLSGLPIMPDQFRQLLVESRAGQDQIRARFLRVLEQVRPEAVAKGYQGDFSGGLVPFELLDQRCGVYPQMTYIHENHIRGFFRQGGQERFFIAQGQTRDIFSIGGLFDLGLKRGVRC
jgi:hypothetical protein